LVEKKTPGDRWGELETEGQKRTAPPLLYVVHIYLPQRLYRIARSLNSTSLFNISPIRLVPVLFTQGINEQQSRAILLSQTRYQEAVNRVSIEIFRQHFDKIVAWIFSEKRNGKTFWMESHSEIMGHARVVHQEQKKGTHLRAGSLTDFPRSRAQTRADMLWSVGKEKEDFMQEMYNIEEIIQSSKKEKNPQILARTADLARKVSGIRFTSCKSAKDRTSMSITWEMSRILEVYHKLPPSNVAAATDEMRVQGVRLENCWKNIGQKKFAFNKLQRSLLPDEYRPNSSVCSHTQS